MARPPSVPPRCALPSQALQLHANFRNIPVDLHSMFKAECSRRKRTMTGVIIAFMRETVKPYVPQQSSVNLDKLSRTDPKPR